MKKNHLLSHKALSSLIKFCLCYSFLPLNLKKEYALTDLTTQTSQPFKEYDQFGEENGQHTHLQLTPNLAAQHNPYIHIANIILETKTLHKNAQI
jgi:hypothetical protein